MNIKSPESLRDNIKTLNSNLDEFNIVEIDGKFYTTNSIVKSFMQENDIINESVVIKSISNLYNINSLIVLDESVTDKDLKLVYETLVLLESLNPFEVAKVSKGVSLFNQFIDQFCSFVKREKYDDAKEIKKYISQCDDILADIQEEKRILKNDSKGKDQLKFSAMYLFNIAKTLFKVFFLPKILSSEKIKWPSAIKKLLSLKDNILPDQKFSKFKKVASVTSTGLGLVTSLSSDIEGLYLSIADYNKLLSKYESQIKDVKLDLNKKLQQIEKSKEIKQDD